ncbi:MAG: hypothetical protein IJV86_00975 [Clostridia bacterium]|nr:hypothetical protein [Clostridia bacterium]
MINEMAKYLSDCPYLDGETVNVNYLKRENAAVSLEMTKERSAVREYADGGALRGVTFVIALRGRLVGSEALLASERCQKIEEWIEEQSLSGNLPQSHLGKPVVDLKVVKGFETATVYGDRVRYEAEIEVIYYI